MDVPVRPIPQVPTEPASGLEYRPTMMVDRGIQVGPGAANLIDEGVQVGLEYPPTVDRGIPVGPGPMVDSGSGPIPPQAAPPGLPPRLMPVRWGSGGQPPRRGGPPPSGFDGGSPPPDVYWWFFAILGLITSAYVYRSFLSLVQTKVLEALNRIENQQMLAEGRDKKPENAEDSRLGLLSGWVGRMDGAWVLLGSLVGGRRLFKKAIDLIVVPPLRRLARVVIPPIIQNVLGPVVEHLVAPVVNAAVRVGMGALSPVTQIITFLVGLSFFKDFIFKFQPEWLKYVLEPITNGAGFLVERFFSTPKGVSFAHGFLERGLKVVSGSLLFGEFFGKFLLLLPHENGELENPEKRMQALVYCTIWGVSIFFIFSDHRFITFFVNNFLSAHPGVEKIIAQPLNQTCLLFSVALVIQVIYPPVVLFFYGWCLYCSGLHFYFLNPVVPASFLPLEPRGKKD